VKLSKAQVRSSVHAIPKLQFDDEQLTSFGGAVLIQALYQRLQFWPRLSAALAGGGTRAYGLASVFGLVVTQLMLGLGTFRDRDAYATDPLLRRVLGLKMLPDVATISRTLAGASHAAFDGVRDLIRALVLERLQRSGLGRITLDFDGSVQSTKRHAEGSAVGFNKLHKGRRSYYPLFCTISQLGMFLDLLHRPGNVHDSNGATEFVTRCVRYIRESLGNLLLEVRLDSAFFQQELLTQLTWLGIEFSASVPFERFPILKHRIEQTTHWTRINEAWSYCEVVWRPKNWSPNDDCRFVFYRQRSLVQRKGPLQLDLFEPRDMQFEYKVVVSNKTVNAAALLEFHNGRGVQEGIFGNAKSGAGLDYVPARALVANQLFTAACMLAHNLACDLVWQASPTAPRTTPNRAPGTPLRTLNSLQKHIFHRAGRLTRPQGALVLTVSANPNIAKEIGSLLAAQLADAA
jgi:hypothetical protein